MEDVRLHITCKIFIEIIDKERETDITTGRKNVATELQTLILHVERTFITYRSQSMQLFHHELSDSKLVDDTRLAIALHLATQDVKMNVKLVFVF